MNSKNTCYHPSSIQGPQMQFEILQQSRVLIVGDSEKSTVYAGGLVHPGDQQRRRVPGEVSRWSRECFFHHRHQYVPRELDKIRVRSAGRWIMKNEKCASKTSAFFKQIQLQPAEALQRHTCHKTRFADSRPRSWSGLQRLEGWLMRECLGRAASPLLAKTFHPLQRRSCVGERGKGDM